jgi:NDP-sugar pyrophosphorylase family protein|tara:strand:+ start:859 stop:1533 length:675 start_codon:yes stop_codon:yes gene_type:complete
MINHAVILAAGRGIRMMPMTKKIPKAMVKIKNQTLILNGIKKIQKYIKNIHITVGYKGSVIAKHVIRNNVRSVINTNDKGNAWWIFNFPFNLINEPIFVLTCDNITNIDFNLIEKDYIKKGKPECFLIPVCPVKRLEGDFIHRRKNIVTKLSRTITSDIYCSGIQIINPYKINKIVKKTEDFNEVWKKLISKKKLVVSDIVPNQWFTIDSIKQLKMYKKKIDNE